MRRTTVSRRGFLGQDDRRFFTGESVFASRMSFSAACLALSLIVVPEIIRAISSTRSEGERSETVVEELFSSFATKK